MRNNSCPSILCSALFRRRDILLLASRDNRGAWRMTPWRLAFVLYHAAYVLLATGAGDATKTHS